MSKRLQVLINPQEYKTYQFQAKKLGLSLGEWVRNALKETINEISPHNKTQQKIKNLRKSIAHHYPTADIDQMLQEIEKGYQ